MFHVALYFVSDTASTETYTLSLHDALPIFGKLLQDRGVDAVDGDHADVQAGRHDGERRPRGDRFRSEEHTSELQSHSDLVCRLLLEKKNSETVHAATGSARGQH